MRKRRLLKYAIGVMVTCIVLAVTAITSFAANESASIGVPSQVKPGDEFKVTLTFTSSEDIGSVKSNIEYNSDVIEFVSGDFANGGGGLCILNGWPDEVGKTVSFDLTFKAVSKGSTQLLMTSTLIYNDLGDLMGKPVSAVTVDITDTATTTPSQTTPSESVSSEISSSESSTTTTTTQPTTTTTTTATTTSAQNENVGGNESQADGEQTTTTQKKPSSDSSSKADKEEESKLDKGAITTILLIIGAVLIVVLLLTSGNSGSKKGSGRKRSSSSRSRSGSSRSSSQRRSSSNTRRKR